MQKSIEKNARLKIGDRIVCKTRESLAKHVDDLCKEDYVLSVNMETYVITIKADERKPEYGRLNGEL